MKRSIEHGMWALDAEAADVEDGFEEGKAQEEKDQAVVAPEEDPEGEAQRPALARGEGH